MYEKRDKIIGYLVTILSSFLASAIMMGITTDNEISAIIIKYTKFNFINYVFFV